MGGLLHFSSSASSKSLRRLTIGTHVSHILYSTVFDRHTCLFSHHVFRATAACILILNSLPPFLSFALHWTLNQAAFWSDWSTSQSPREFAIIWPLNGGGEVYLISASLLASLIFCCPWLIIRGSSDQKHPARTGALNNQLGYTGWKISLVFNGCNAQEVGRKGFEGGKGKLNVGERFFSLCVLFLLFKALTLRVEFGERRKGADISFAGDSD